MLLDVPQHVLHVVSVEIMIVLRVVVSAAPVPVACCRELHVHDWRLVREVLRFVVVLWRPVGSVMRMGAVCH